MVIKEIKFMNLRRLELKDAPLMFEWMHDESVVKDLQTNFVTKTIDDCKKFITMSVDTSHDLHLAIVNDDDTYMGTVSLKHITESSAEFAIIVRKVAMGKGYSKYAMSEIIRIGLEELKLERIYWCVSPDNKRAVRFYDKNGYQRIEQLHSMIIPRGYGSSQIEHYIWYLKTQKPMGGEILK